MKLIYFNQTININNLTIMERNVCNNNDKTVINFNKILKNRLKK